MSTSPEMRARTSESQSCKGLVGLMGRRHADGHPHAWLRGETRALARQGRVMHHRKTVSARRDAISNRGTFCFPPMRAEAMR